jgi:hypothetical protein
MHSFRKGHVMKRSKAILALALAISLFATACTDQWIKIALADLPVLTQMALNIGTLITTLQDGKQISAADAAAIQNISAQASSDLDLLESLYNDYKANPTPDVMAKIRQVISDIDTNLPALLQAAHIADPVLAARVAAGMNLILSTVSSFAALLPQPVATMQRMQRQGIPGVRKEPKPPKPEELKRQWNQQVAPQFQTSCGFFCSLGNAVGEAKWGGS